MHLRTTLIEGQPWFVANDVCRALGLFLTSKGQPNVTMACEKLAGAEKGFSQIATLGGPTRMRIVSESGLYKLVMRSDKPEAREFQNWVTGTVLPSIRKLDPSEFRKVTRKTNRHLFPAQTGRGGARALTPVDESDRGQL